jgi:hypothetical protein
MSAQPGRDFATPDDPATCGICGKETSIAMIARHLITEHDIDPDDIADAEIIDATGQRPDSSAGS